MLLDRLPLLLLVAAPAFAEVPGGHLYFGVGAFVSAPMVSQGSSSADLALSLEFAWEFEHALVAFDAVGSGFSGGTGYGLATMRTGWLFGRSAIAPCLSTGLGYLSVNSVSCTFGECSGSPGRGLAWIAEAGLLFFRDQRFGRATLMAQFVQPLFSLESGAGSFQLMLIGLRLFI